MTDPAPLTDKDRTESHARYNGGMVPERRRIVPKPGGGYQVERVHTMVDVLGDFESYDSAAQWIRESTPAGSHWCALRYREHFEPCCCQCAPCGKKEHRAAGGRTVADNGPLTDEDLRQILTNNPLSQYPMVALYCLICERLRIRPLFFIVEGDDNYPICHYCVERIWGNAVATERGGWEKQLSGNTWLVKVRR